MLLRVATRGSKLSIAQTDIVVEKIKEIHHNIAIERTIIATAGDLDRATPIHFLSEKGIFEKEVDQAVLDGKADFAVHSLKDIPTFITSELTIACIPARGSTADVLVSQARRKLAEMPNGSRVGTSSLLRAAQVRRVSPELRVEPIRGNVDTRVRKVESGEYDAVILAEAGLARLGMMDKVAERLSLDDFMPAPGQGALAIVAKRQDSKLLEILKSIEHPPTRAEAEAERELVKTIEGGCKVPIGAIGVAGRDTIQLTASIYSIDGKQRLVVRKEGFVKDPVAVGRSVGKDLLEKGAKKIEETWRAVYS